MTIRPYARRSDDRPMLTAAEAERRRHNIRAEFARRVESCQTRYRVEAEAILRARKHLTPLSKIIRARELLRDIYLRETAELSAISAEQTERLREVDAEAPPIALVEGATPRPGTSSSGSDTGEQIHPQRRTHAQRGADKRFVQKLTSVRGPASPSDLCSPKPPTSALEAAEMDYLKLPSLPESVASAKRKTPSPGHSPGQSPEHQRLAAWSPKTDYAPGAPVIPHLGNAEPAFKRQRISDAAQRAVLFESLLKFARDLTDKEEHKEFLDELQNEFETVNRD